MTRGTPFDDVGDLFDQLGEELDEVGEALESRVRGDLRVDVLESDGEYVVRADLPGFDTDDIELTVSGRKLTIRAEAAEETDEADATTDGRYHRHERRARSFARRLRLPGEVVEEEATADYDTGVLTITLPKPTATEEGTRIDVE
ncbi:Hsp20/alpha crystallin family protein [Halobaculum lipolyticum]|uniref:Hsp20/alpha crystallin family protein n=1 Tax=Halobaculum lipolyticum TaxID=3032001 RepID=A0ABD5WEM5_9EURY|nr:Hsp20/alpha crystallin family protein [Halobaculum sp. DT31]